LSDCRLMLNEQFVSYMYIMAKTS